MVETLDSTALLIDACRPFSTLGRVVMVETSWSIRVRGISVDSFSTLGRVVMVETAIRRRMPLSSPSFSTLGRVVMVETRLAIAGAVDVPVLSVPSVGS